MTPAADAPFDDVAASYDETFGRSPAGRLFRFRLAERIAEAVPRGSSLLDIGAGTGEDALWLSSQGFQVSGIDASGGMVDRTRAKISRTRHPVNFQHADLLSFSSLTSFDAVYSNLGAMNCIPLADWARALSPLVRRRGRAFLVLMGRRPLPEFVRDGQAAWRRRQESMVRIGSGSIAVHYPSVGAIANALRNDFRVERTETFGIIVPPSTMDQWPRRHSIAFGLCASIEKIVARRRMLCGFSDHFLVELSRR